MERSKYSLPPLLGFHGCDHDVGESILSGTTTLIPSANDYDWLGKGIYFWVDSYQRGYEWAVAQAKRKGSGITKPFVIGAFIYPGYCLNLADYGVRQQLVDAHTALIEAFKKSGITPPKNQSPLDGISLRRNLDCAVINALHSLREESAEQPYDSVYGFFEEGRELYAGSDLKEKTHVQISVINPECILGYFRP